MASRALFSPVRRDRRGTLLCLIGAGMLVAGFLYPGSQVAVPTTLIVLGAGEVAIGLLLPRMTEFEIGPGGLKTKLIGDDVAPLPAVVAEAERLNRFAYLMLGDPDLAREQVEDALARAQAQRRQVPADERGAFLLRTLIQLLDTAKERHWLRDSPSIRAELPMAQASDPATASIVAALGKLDYPARAAFVLLTDWQLPVEEVASVMRRPIDAVSHDVTNAREALRPYVEQASRP